ARNRGARWRIFAQRNARPRTNIFRRVLRSLLLSHAEPNDPGRSRATHGPAWQGWWFARILANRGNKGFVGLAREAFAICVEAAKTRIRVGRDRAGWSRRPSFATITFRTGR